MFETTVAGSLPKPAWLAEPEVLWAAWQPPEGDILEQAKLDATALCIHAQEDCGIDIVSDGEQSRQHFVHGFLAAIDGLDFDNRKRIGIRDDRYEADCPRVIGPVSRKHSVHAAYARHARAQTDRKLKFTLPGPMTIVDTIADEHYGDRATLAMEFARLLNDEARELQALGIDVIQFDEPAYNVYMSAVAGWGIDSLERAIEGLSCTTAIHICYGYGIQANIDWKGALGDEWRQYEETFPVLAAGNIDQVSLECINSHVPMSLIGLLDGKDILVGAIDVATNQIETPDQVADVIREALKYAPAERIFPSTNCGMVPLSRDVTYAKLRALAAGAAIMRAEI
ncbi:MAG: methionine synthase [Rhodospirillales bacterium]|nr:methionine synthase [Rhodospirillales bacterium]